MNVGDDNVLTSTPHTVTLLSLVHQMWSWQGVIFCRKISSIKLADIVCGAVGTSSLSIHSFITTFQ